MLEAYDLAQDSTHPYGIFRKFSGTGSNFENFTPITGITAVKVVFGTPEDTRNYFQCDFATSLTMTSNVADPTIVTAFTENFRVATNNVMFYSETFVCPSPDDTDFFKLEGQIATGTAYVCSITIYYNCNRGSTAASSSTIAATGTNASAGAGTGFSF